MWRNAIDLQACIEIGLHIHVFSWALVDLSILCFFGWVGDRRSRDLGTQICTPIRVAFTGYDRRQVVLQHD